MYHRLYNLGIRTYGLGLRAASLFNDKARNWVQGRKNIFEELRASIHPGDEILWFHAASLGEAEQGLPVIQRLRQEFPHKKILLTFFSPSGMKHFKHKEIADYIFYLPLDTAASAQKFVDAVKPELAFFIKYEIWPNFFREIQNRNIPLVIAPAVFRADQFYFKNPHRKFFLPLLRKVSSIMVQDEASQRILTKNRVQSLVVGDSRFDRVLQNTRTLFDDETLEKFSAGRFTLIGGSSWEPEEKILKHTLEQNPGIAVILAPHDIRKENIDRLEKLFRKSSFRYSEKPGEPGKYRVCIIDNIGMLSRLYRFGQVALIGGAFGKGIHNSLEAVAYGLPVFFGPNHKNFVEPRDMLQHGFAFEIKNQQDLQRHVQPMLENPSHLEQLSATAKKYVEEKAGSVEKIVGEVRRLIT